MKNFKWWQVVGAAVLGTVLAGCGSSDDTSSTSLRVVNSTLTHPTLNVLVGGTATFTGVATDAISTASAPTAGSLTLQVNDGTSGTALATTVPTLTSSLHYTLVAYESGGVVKTVVLNEDYTVPTTGSAQIHFYNAATDVSKLDIYVTDTTVTDISALSPTISYTTTTALSAAVTLSPKSYKIWVTAAGDKSDIRLLMPTVALADQQNAIVILTPSTGGVLLNGGTLIQQGAYTATRNTTSRVRLAAAMPNNLAVAATAGSTLISADGLGTAAPALLNYVVVPAASTLNISVGGNSVAAPATKLVAGGDSTLLVYGATAGTAVATLLSDDNRPPTDTTTSKVRFINGVTSDVGQVTLKANTVTVGTVAQGVATGYVTVPVTTTSTTTDNLVFTSSKVGGNYFTATTPLLAANVYTVLLADKAAASPPVQALVVGR